MKKFRVIRKDSGLKSGSREVSLTEALKYPGYNPVQGKSVLLQSHEALKSVLKKMCPVQKGINFSQVRVERPSENFRLKMKIPVCNPV